MNEYKMQPIYKLILRRICDREKWISGSFLIALCIILFYEYSCADIFECLFHIAIEFCRGEKNTIYTLALSYISGVIVYFFTSVFIEVKRSKPILFEIENILKSLISEFNNFAQELQIGDLNHSDEASEKAFIVVQQYGKKSETHYSFEFCKSCFMTLAKKIDILTTTVLNHSFALTLDELDTIIYKIRHQEVSEQLKYNHGIDNCLTECEIKQYVKDIALLYTEVHQLHTKLRNRIYK